jgi:hypothetical protein
LPSDRTYGARRVWRDLLARGVECGLHSNRATDAVAGFAGKLAPEALPKDEGDRQMPFVPSNILDQQFGADRPNQKWSSPAQLRPFEFHNGNFHREKSRVVLQKCDGISPKLSIASFLTRGRFWMGGFSVYLVFLTATLFAAPRRPSLYIVFALAAFTAFGVRLDLAEQPNQQSTEQASDIDLIVLAKAHHTIGAKSLGLQ